MNAGQYKYLRFFALLLPLLLLLSCSDDNKGKETDWKRIIAVIGEDTLFVDDFIARCEYTIRPDYCQAAGQVDKNICLNSFIAEKLFALEAEKTTQKQPDTKLMKVLQGLKEQLMREELVRDRIINEISIPDREIQQAYLNAQKIVHTEALFIPDGLDINKIHNQACQGVSFDQLHEKYPGIPEKVERNVTWGHIDQEAQQAIFSENVKAGSVLSPLETKGGYRLIKVLGWQETVELSEANRNMAKENIKKRLLDFYIRKKYLAYAQNMMKGKRIDFFTEGWNVVVNALSEMYMGSAKSGTKALPSPQNLEQVYKKFKNEEDLPFLKIDGEIWRISDFKKAIEIHPLEIKEKGLSEDNFKYKLRAAIASLIVDEHLTKLAYQKDYDKSETIVRQIQTWRNYFLFLRQRDQFLMDSGYKGKISKDYFEAFDNYLTPYFERLKVKYDDQIQFNPAAVASVHLTEIPMITHKTKGPYLQVVPPFPVVTNSVKTNYKRIQSINE